LELEETHKFSSWISSFAATAAAAGEGGVGVGVGGEEEEMSFVFRGSRGDLESGLHSLMPDRRNSSSSSSNMVRGCFFLDYSSRNCLSLSLFFHLLYFFVLQLGAILFFSFFASLALLIWSSTIQKK